MHSGRKREREKKRERERERKKERKKERKHQIKIFTINFVHCEKAESGSRVSFTLEE